MAFGILGYNWVMYGIIKEEAWAWKDIVSQKKHLGLFCNLLICVQRKDRRVFDEVEKGLDRIREDGSKPLECLLY